ncbi:hypothetical protein QW180_08980 [Vibrio sinaloensis]|nr:hypothetical protein [Vibrio sinaloensis]
MVGLWRVLYTAMMTKEVLLHAHDGRGAHLARLISLFTNKPYIISRRVDKALKGKASAKTYRNAAHLVAVSQKKSRIILLNSINMCRLCMTAILICLPVMR